MRALSALALISVSATARAQGGELAPVSYNREVRPLLMARCAGCHQPAKASGDVVLTAHAKLLVALDGFPLVSPGDPGRSLLVQVVEPWDGEPAEMPKDGAPLDSAETALLRRWIAEGAADDSPPERARPTADAPPVYAAPPVVTGLGFSPDGELLAVTGRNEVLVHRLTGGAPLVPVLEARLVGLSERLESLAFSPDGARLAVAGGSPARMGELQIWNVAAHELEHSISVTHDTLRGVSWSPDGRLVAFGCADATVRAVDAGTGAQVLYNGAHEDWVLGTAWSVDGSHLLSVGRDRSLKLTKVETQQFIDNVTSITPGALKGGLMAVARHPTRDEVLVGGADGTPAVYRVYREKKREIGDDYNLVRAFGTMAGRVFAAAWSPDGERVYAGASADGHGEVRAWSAVDGAPLWSRAALAPVYSLAVHPGGGLIAAAGFDGEVVLLDAVSGALVIEFAPMPLAPDSAAESIAAAVPAPASAADLAATARAESTTAAAAPRAALEAAPEDLAGVEVVPAVIALDRPAASVQILVTGVLASGERVDVTRAAELLAPSEIAELSPRGLARPLADGEGVLRLRVGARELEVQVVVTGQSARIAPSFQRDVMPVVARAGCNAGTCHGSANGRNGFKLSLRGYDPLADHRALTDDLAARRIDRAEPEESLFLLKPTAGVPHEGGQRVAPDSREYELLRDWVAAGAGRDDRPLRVESISLLPRAPAIARAGLSQQTRVLATYSDGTVRDVSALAFVTTSDIEVTRVDDQGLVTALRRGEASILARYEGRYDATRLVVMGDREGFTWNDEPAHGWIDELVHEKLRAVRALPSALCTDAEFLRRVTLDLTGRVPAPEDVRTFLLDEREPRAKREELIDRLIGGPAFVEHWTNRWCDLLQVSRAALGAEDAVRFREWIRAQVASNAPYDELARAILTGTGTTAERPPAAWFRTQREPDVAMETTTQLFLGVRFSCNKCHDHPFERWTQGQHWELAAWFGRTEIETEGPEGGGPERVVDLDTGELIVPDSGAVAEARFPFVHAGAVPAGAPRREQLAAWVTAPENPYFARSYVNRVWSYLLGTGLIDPVDDIRAGNPPTNPALLDRLTSEFIERDFDTRWLLREICRSRAYQRSVETNAWNSDDALNYSHAIARRLPAEVLYDAVHAAAGSRPRLFGARPGTRAAEVADGGADAVDAFLTLFGRPPRESACECERSSGMSLGQALNLVNGPTIAEAIRDPQNAVAALAAATEDAAEIADELFVRFLARPATAEELGELAPALDPMLVESADSLPPERRAEYERTLADWEAQHLPLTEWSPLALADGSRSTGGATVERTADGALLLSGASPETDALVLVAATDFALVTGLRIEALADPSLPAGGPGRADNGNFVLAELTATAVPLLDPSSPRRLSFARATADYSQDGFSAEGAIDGDRATGWAVSPRLGLPHVAVFELAEDLVAADGVLLVLRLEQPYGGRHTLGKLRISLTGSARPVRQLALPAEIMAALATPAEARSAEARQALHAHVLAERPDLRAAIRLGAAQDLAWALANSAGFLFNR